MIEFNNETRKYELHLRPEVIELLYFKNIETGRPLLPSHSDKAKLELLLNVIESAFNTQQTYLEKKLQLHAKFQAISIVGFLLVACITIFFGETLSAYFNIKPLIIHLVGGFLTGLFALLSILNYLGISPINRYFPFVKRRTSSSKNPAGTLDIIQLRNEIVKEFT